MKCDLQSLSQIKLARGLAFSVFSVTYFLSFQVPIFEEENWMGNSVAG